MGEESTKEGRSERRAALAMATSYAALVLAAPYCSAVIISMVALPVALVATLVLMFSAAAIGRSGRVEPEDGLGGGALMGLGILTAAFGVALLVFDMTDIFIDIQRGRASSWTEGIPSLGFAAMCAVVAFGFFFKGLGRSRRAGFRAQFWLSLLVAGLVPLSLVSFVVQKTLFDIPFTT